MLTPSPSSHHSRSSTTNRLSNPRRSPITTPTNTTKKIKTALLLKYAFLAILILLVYFLLRINLQLIQRLDTNTNGGVNQNNVATIRAKAANNNNINNNNNQLRANSIDTSVDKIQEVEEQALQNRLVTLREEVTTMQKKVDDMKQRMEHVKSIHRSSSASAILGGSGGSRVSKSHLLHRANFFLLII
eukprot:scaffold4823_cov82-Skeletonema_dohrnii-CCMP3373.AAC.14